MELTMIWKRQLDA